MGFDLTNERIQDTYEQLLQISGSTIVDGTGSVAPVSITSASYSDFAVTASYAENAGDIDTSSLTPLSTFNAYTSSNDSTFTAYTSSTSASLADINNQIDALEAGSGSADWTLITNKPNGLVSSSAQTLANVDGGTITTLTASNIHFETGPPFSSIATITSEGVISPTIDGFTITNSSIANLTGLGDVVIDTTSTFGRVRADVDESPSGLVLSSDAANNSYIRLNTSNIEINNDVEMQASMTASNALISGDLVVNGTASFAVIESITGSAKIIGDAYIVLNNNTPTERYAGIVVQDSGSTNNTASFEFDGQTNDWFYEYTDDGGATEEFGAVMFGPGYNTRGSHVYPSNNTILKGTGDHHIVDSNITDDGTSVTVSTSLTASAFKGDGSALTNLPSTLGNGVGSDSIITQNLTSQDAASAAIFGIAIGDTAQIINSNSTNAVAIGRDSAVNNGPNAVALGRQAQANSDDAIAIGNTATVSADDGIAIGTNSSVTSVGGISIGDNTSADNNAVKIGRNGSAGTLAVAIGYNSAASNQRSVAVGTGTSVNGDYAVALGFNTSANGESSIGIGNGADVSNANEISIGGIFKYDGTSQITLEGSVSASGDLQSNIISASGNVQVDGQLYSPTFAGSVASSTSSIDFDNGNFATLSLSAATFVANPSNIQSGTTYTLIITSGSQVSNYGTSWKFAGGNQPILSDGTDILTCVSDGTNLYATALANFS